MIETYHRPGTLEQALTLLANEDTTVLGGGTSLVAAGGPSAVVDLQDLGLAGIAADGDRVTIGAMTRLREVAESDLVPQMVRELARREAPNTIRNAATIGGTVATADPESELVAGMLVYDAMATITDGDETTMRLDEYLSTRPRGIITGVSLATGGVAGAARTGRTPADRPIVMAVARRDQSGSILLALTGVAPTPMLVDPVAIPALEPPADFRGSSEYRRHLAGVLAARAISGLST